MSGVVAGIGFRAIAGTVMGKAASAGGSALKWLGSLDLVHLLLLIVCLFGGYQTGGRWMQHRHTVKVEGQLSKCALARATDAKTYADGQAAAKVANHVQVAGTEAKYQKVSTNEKQSYASDLAELRALNKRLRAQVAAAHSGAAGVAGASPDNPAAAGADANGMQVPAANDVHEDAAEIELRLLHLQRYVAGILAVDPNEAPKP